MIHTKKRSSATSILGGSFLVILLSLSLCGCCVSRSLSIQNDTGNFVTLAAKDANRGADIPAGKRREFPFWEGSLLVVGGSNSWFYPKITTWDHPEATKRVFRFGVCQAGFGYFRTSGTLGPGGHLTIGRGVYEPETQKQR